MKCLFVILFTAGSILSGQDLPQRERLEQLRRSPDLCMEAIRDRASDSIVRRTAFRTLLESPVAEEALRLVLDDPDPELRQYAVYETFVRHGVDSYLVLKKMTGDPDPQVAETVLQCSKNLNDKGKSRELLMLLMKSEVRTVSRAAAALVDFPYFREVKLLRDDPTYDHEIETVKSIPLALEGWRFRCDPKAAGHRAGWFRPDFDDKGWKELKIGVWETQGFPGYDGIAWYRLSFKMPPKSDCQAVELHFEAVDETAWVWLNGKYAGQHDVGPSGWDKPFDLDITQEIKWDAENILVVRVEDTMAAGGIWKPVTVNLVK